MQLGVETSGRGILGKGKSMGRLIEDRNYQGSYCNQLIDNAGFAWEKTRDPKNLGFSGGFFGFFQSHFEKTQVFSKFQIFFKKNF